MGIVPHLSVRHSVGDASRSIPSLPSLSLCSILLPDPAPVHSLCTPCFIFARRGAGRLPLQKGVQIRQAGKAPALARGGAFKGCAPNQRSFLLRLPPAQQEGYVPSSFPTHAFRLHSRRCTGDLPVIDNSSILFWRKEIARKSLETPPNSFHADREWRSGILSS